MRRPWVDTTRRARFQTWYWRRRARGLCGRCGRRQADRLWACWDCRLKESGRAGRFPRVVGRAEPACLHAGLPAGTDDNPHVPESVNG